MKKFGVIISVILILIGCEKDEIIVEPTPIENKGQSINFSSSSNSYFFNQTDTFVVIKGGIPPYIIESSEVSTSFIKEDTLFFIAEILSSPRLFKINVIDNKGYNRGQFSFISSPERVSLFIDYPFVPQVNAKDSSMNLIHVYNYGTGFMNYYPKIDSFYISFSGISDLSFYINRAKTSQSTVPVVNFNDFSSFSPIYGDYSLDSTSTITNISVEYNILGIPKSIDFLFDVKNNIIGSSSNIQLMSSRKYDLI